MLLLLLFPVLFLIGVCSSLVVGRRKISKYFRNYTILLIIFASIVTLFLTINHDSRNIIIYILSRFATLFRDGSLYDYLGISGLSDLFWVPPQISFEPGTSLSSYFAQINSFMNVNIYEIDENLVHRVGLNMNVGLLIGHGGSLSCVFILVLGLITFYSESFILKNPLFWPLSPVYYVTVYRLLSQSYQISFYRTFLIAFVGILTTWFIVKPIRMLHSSKS